jgi:hypothetical protein
VTSRIRTRVASIEVPAGNVQFNVGVPPLPLIDMAETNGIGLAPKMLGVVAVALFVVFTLFLKFNVHEPFGAMPAPNDLVNKFGFVSNGWKFSSMFTKLP